MFSLRFPFPKVSLSNVLALIFTGIAAINFAQTNLSELKRGHQGWLETYALSPGSNKYLATVGSDHQIILWDYFSGKQIREIKNQFGVVALNISPDDRYLFSADTASRIKKWDLNTGKLLFNIVAHQAVPSTEEEEFLEAMTDGDPEIAERIKERYVRPKFQSKEYLPPTVTMTLSPDGLWLITAGIDDKIKLWNAQTGQFMRNITAFENLVWLIICTKDKQHLITQDTEGVSVYAFSSGKKIAAFKCDDFINAPNLSKDHQYFYCLTNRYRTVQKIDLKNGQIVSSLKLEAPLYRMVKLLDEATIVGIGNRDSTFQFDLKTGKVIDRGKGLQNVIHYQLDQKNQLVFIGDEDKRIIRYDPQLKKNTQSFGVFTPDIQTVGFSDDGLHVLVNDTEMKLSKIDLNQPTKPILNTYALTNNWDRHHIKISNDSKQLFAVASNGIIESWDLTKPAELNQRADKSTGITLFENRYNSATITDFHIAPKAQQLVFSDFMFGLHFINPENLSDQFYQNEYNVEEFNLIQVSKDASSILVNLIDDGFGEFYQLNIKNWTAEGTKNEKLSKKFTVTNVIDRLTQFDFTPDFKFLLYRNEVGEGGIQEVESGQKLLALNNCRFAGWLGKTQKQVLLISQQKVVIWDVTNKKISGQYDLPFSPLHAALHPQGNLILLVHPDQSLVFCNALDGKPLLSFFWQAGTNNFQIKNSEGKIDATAWGKLQALLALKLDAAPTQTVDVLSPASSAKMPDDLDAVVLNLGHNYPIVHMGIHNDGKTLWTVDDREIGKVWSLPEMRELRSVSHFIFNREIRYLQGDSGQKLRLNKSGNAHVWELDLNTGNITETNDKPNGDFFFDSKSLNSYELMKYDLKTLKFVFPDQSSLLRNLSFPFTTHRYLHNSEKNIISVYGEHYGKYDFTKLVSFYGQNFSDSIEINVYNYKFENLWAWPKEDSLVGKTKDGYLYLFHPLKKTQAFTALFQGKKINNLAFSPDQQLLAVAFQEDGAVEVRQVKGKVLSRRRHFPTSSIIHLVFTPTGENLLLSDGYRIWNWDLKKDSVSQSADFYEVNEATKSYDSRLYVHLFPSGKIVFKTPSDHSEYSYKIVDLYKGETSSQEVHGWYSSFYKINDKAILVGLNSEYFDLFNQQFFKIPLWNGSIHKLASARKGNRWGLIKHDAKEFVWWDNDQGKAIFSKSPKVSFHVIAIDSRDSLIALGEKNQVWVLDAKTGKEKAIIPIVADSPERVIIKFSTDSHYLFIDSPIDGRITVWDLKMNVLLRTIALPYGGMEIFSISEDNQTIYGRLDSWVLAYNLQGKELYRLDLKMRDIVAEYFPADKKIIAVSNHGIVFQIDAPSGNLLKTLYLGTMEKWISIDQNKHFETSENAATYVHYRNKIGSLGHFSAQKPSSSALKPEAFPALLNSKKVNVVSSAKTTVESNSPFYLANAILATQLKVAKTNPTKIYTNRVPLGSHIVAALFTKDDQKIIIQDISGKIIFLEKATLHWLKTIQLQKPSLVKSILSPDGQYFICVDGSSTISLIDANKGTLLQQKVLENSNITSLAISPNGRTLAVGTLQGFVHLLQVPSLSSIEHIRPTGNKILSLAINPENDHLVFADIYSNLYVYGISPLYKALSPKLLGNYNSHGLIRQLEFGPGQSLILRVKDLIFSIPYRNSASSPQNFVIRTEARWMHIDPSNPDQLYYYAQPTYTHRWMVYDLKKLTLVDSIRETGNIYALSNDGKSALYDYLGTSSNISVYDLKTQKNKSISSTPLACSNWDLSGNILHYQSGEGVHRIDLAKSQTESIKGQYYYGKFLKQGDKYYYVGKFYLPREGTGKKLLGDTSYLWQPDKRPGISAVSNNGLYLAHWPNSNDSIFVFSALDQKLVYKHSSAKQEKFGLYISNNGRYLTLFKSNSGFNVYDLSTKKLILSEEGSSSDPVYSKDNRNLIVSSPNGSRTYDLMSGKIIRTIAFSIPQKQLRIATTNTRFTLLYSPGGAFQLWDVNKNSYLGDFYFFPLWAGKGAWAFVGLDGRYDGNEEGLKNLYTVDESALKSKTLSLDPGTGYTPGLVSQLIK